MQTNNNCKIWGTCTANKTPPFDPTSPNVHKTTYSRYVQYARDPTPQELKIFLNMWRMSEYKKGNIFPPPRARSFVSANGFTAHQTSPAAIERK